MRAAILGISPRSHIGLLQEDFLLIYNILSGGINVEMDVYFFDNSMKIVTL